MGFHRWRCFATFGDISHVTTPGLNFKIPFVQGKTSYPIDLREIRIEKASIASKGNQSLQDVVVNFQYTIPEGQIAWLHQNARDFHQRAQTLGVKVANAILGTTDSTVIADTRNTIETRMMVALQKEFDESGLGLNVTTAVLNNFEWDPAFKASIQQNNQVKNEVIRLEAEKRREEINAEKKVIEAQGVANSLREQAAGERDAQIAKTDGIAYQLRTEGQARSEAFKNEIEAFGKPEVYVEFTKAKSWDGKLPTIVSGSGEGMFIDLRSPEAVKNTVPAPALTR
jgi:regulator of protease activity HflC (stomatin/prohibitin superfamily)